MTTTSMQFNNKAEYLVFRANWRIQYNQLSQQIRDYKFCRWFTSLRRADRITPALSARYEKLKAIYGSRFYYIEPLKVQATLMLEERKASKVEAQRQYLAVKAKVAALAPV